MNKQFIKLTLGLFCVFLSTTNGLAIEPTTPIDQFSKDNFFPKDLWGKKLSDEEVYKYSDNPIENTSDLFPNEIVIYHTSKGEKYFAQIVESKNDKISFMRYNPKLKKISSYELNYTGRNTPTNKFYKLSSLWHWIWQPSILWDSFDNAIMCFLNLTEYQSMTNQFGKSLVVPSNSNVIIMGDLHGDFLSLQKTLYSLNQTSIINKYGILADGCHMIFTGDIADRGYYGVECWYVIMSLAYHNPGRVHIIRGNHEYDTIAKRYGFNDEFEQKFGKDQKWQKMLTVWNRLPLLYLIGVKTPGLNFYDFIMFSHAGFDPHFSVANLMRAAITHPDGKIITQQISDSPNYNWSDLKPSDIPNMASVKAQRVWEGTRGAGEECINHAAIHEYFSKIAEELSEEAILSSLFRGHEHRAVETNFGKLIDSPTKYWKNLSPGKRYPLSENYDTYTIISAPNISTVGAAPYFTYGRLEAAKNGRWYLYPYIEQIINKA